MDPEDSFLGQCLLWLRIVYWYGSWGEVCALVKPPVQWLLLGIIKQSLPSLQRSGIWLDAGTCFFQCVAFGVVAVLPAVAVSTHQAIAGQSPSRVLHEVSLDNCLTVDLRVTTSFLSVRNWKQLSAFSRMMAGWLFPFMALLKIGKVLGRLERFVKPSQNGFSAG